MKLLLARWSQVFIFVIGIILLSETALIGQTPTGSISGLVKDESGAVIPGATVVVTNAETGVRRSVPSDAGGRYRAPGLDPGSYRVEAQAAGFQTTMRQGIELTVGREIEIEMLLRLGQVEQVTEVTAVAPLVETVTNTLSGLVDEQTIRELPLNGRSFDQLIALQPGVHWFRTGGHRADSGLAAEYFSVGGSRALANLFLLDGIELVGSGGQSVSPGGALGKNMGVDAIQEFTVLLGNYSAAYGKKAGGVVSVVTKPGTNQLHGSAFGFHRNDNLDARNFFDPNSQPPEFRRNQFGGSLGGPILRDKTFFFGTYEGLREGLGETNIAIVPDSNAREGFLPDPQNPGQLINVGVAPSMRPFLPALFGPPNGRSFGDGAAEHIASPTRVSRQDFFLVRMDHHFSEKDSLFARYNFSDAALQDPDDSSLFMLVPASRSQSITLEEKRVYPTTLNIARFGFSRSSLAADTLAIGALDSSLRFIEGIDGPGLILFGSGTAGTRSGPLTSTGRSTLGRSYALNQFELSDQIYHYRGPHSLQFGVNFQRIQNNENSPSDFAGRFEFDSLEQLLLGQPFRFRGQVPGGDASKSYRRVYFAGFVQDDYKILPSLTLNLGLRYEIATVPVEVHNRISNYHREFVDGILVLESEPHVGSPFWDGNRGVLAPRVGFAWDPLSDGKTVLRAGFGIFYDQIVTEYRSTTNGNLPFFSRLTIDNPSFPLGFSGGGGSAGTPVPDGIDFDLDVPTKLQWNFSIQRQVASNSAVNIAYVGSHAYHLTRVTDFNLPVPQISSDGTKFHAAGLRRRNRALGGSESIITDVHGFYQALQMDFTQRLSEGWRAKASYTYSKNMDEASGNSSQNALGSPTIAQDPENIRAERGLSAFDSRHNFALNTTYDLPGASLNGLAGKVIGGWQVSGILTANSGEPFTVQTGFSRSRNLARQNGDRPNLKSGLSNNPVLGGPDRYFDSNVFELPPAGFYGNVGRNTLTGPGFVNVDLSLVKIIPLGERLRSEFRAEFFNLLNRANFGLPDLAVFNSNGTVRGAAGRITSTANTSRQIQFGLKLSF